MFRTNKCESCQIDYVIQTNPVMKHLRIANFLKTKCKYTQSISEHLRYLPPPDLTARYHGGSVQFLCINTVVRQCRVISLRNTLSK